MNQQLDIDGNRHDIAPEHESMRLFDSAPQLRGQIALDTDPAPIACPYELRRHCHTVGRDNTRHHVCRPGARTTLCGKSTQDFNCELSAADVPDAIAGKYPQLVCRRCLSKLPTMAEQFLAASCAASVAAVPTGIPLEAIPAELQATALECVADHVEEGYLAELARFYIVPNGLYRCMAFERYGDRFRAGTCRPIGFPDGH